MSIYERATPTSEVKQTEVHIYGSSRIGIEQRNITYSTSPFAWLESVQHRDAGTKRYELTDHLGNVRVTISDLLVPRPASSFGYATQDAEVIDRRDYYPFGMEMPGRRWRAATEAAGRFGFNGKENDNEVKGEGNQQDYGFRIYDPRVARFLSGDPLAGEYPWYTPYQFAGNTPIQAIDLDGLEPFFVMGTLQNKESTKHTQLRKSLELVVSGLSLNDLQTTPIDYGFTWNEIDRNGRTPHGMMGSITDFFRDNVSSDGSNGLLNNESDRAVAAQSLAEYIARNHIPGQPVTILGYSHGGNVAIQAAPIVRDILGPDVEINLVTLFTPAYNSGTTKENPRLISDKIDAHYHYFSLGDNVVTAALGAHEYYKNFLLPGAVNGAHDKLLQVNVDKHRTKGTGSAGHGSLYYPETMKDATKSLSTKQSERKAGE
ncbi:MAG: RHS repeat domain-containing protein [Bacteroidota bacterium]